MEDADDVVERSRGRREGARASARAGAPGRSRRRRSRAGRRSCVRGTMMSRTVLSPNSSDLVEQARLLAVDDALVGAEVEDALELLLRQRPGSSRGCRRGRSDADWSVGRRPSRAARGPASSRRAGRATARETATGEAAPIALGVISAKMKSVTVEKSDRRSRRRTGSPNQPVASVVAERRGRREERGSGR